MLVLTDEQVLQIHQLEEAMVNMSRMAREAAQGSAELANVPEIAQHKEMQAICNINANNYAAVASAGMLQVEMLRSIYQDPTIPKMQ